MIVSDLIEAVAQEFRISSRDLIGPYRYSFLMPPRFGLYVILHERGMSKAQIGRICGNRDHSTVIHGIVRAKTMMDKDPVYRSSINKLINLRPKIVPPEKVNAA